MMVTLEGRRRWAEAQTWLGQVWGRLTLKCRAARPAVEGQSRLLFAARMLLLTFNSDLISELTDG